MVTIDHLSLQCYAYIGGAGRGGGAMAGVLSGQALFYFGSERRDDMDLYIRGRYAAPALSAAADAAAARRERLTASVP